MLSGNFRTTCPRGKPFSLLNRLDEERWLDSTCATRCRPREWLSSQASNGRRGRIGDRCRDEARQRAPKRSDASPTVAHRPHFARRVKAFAAELCEAIEQKILLQKTNGRARMVDACIQIGWRVSISHSREARPCGRRGSQVSTRNRPTAALLYCCNANVSVFDPAQRAERFAPKKPASHGKSALEFLVLKS